MRFERFNANYPEVPHASPILVICQRLAPTYWCHIGIYVFYNISINVWCCGCAVGIFYLHSLQNPRRNKLFCCWHIGFMLVYLTFLNKIILSALYIAWSKKNLTTKEKQLTRVSIFIIESNDCIFTQISLNNVLNNLSYNDFFVLLY